MHGEVQGVGRAKVGPQTRVLLTPTLTMHPRAFFVASLLIAVTAATPAAVNVTAEDVTPVVVTSARTARARALPDQMVSCAMSYDTGCFLDAAEDYLELKRNELLVEADKQTMMSTGRSDLDSRPSHLVNVLGKLISELRALFKDGVSGLFTSARESEDSEDENQITGRSNGVQTKSSSTPRKKKKEGLIQKIIKLVKLIIIGVVIVAKICLSVKIFHAILKFKFWLVAVGHLALQAIKLWIDAKHKKHDKVIYYENAHHDHHYDDHGGEEWVSAPADEHEYWHRRASNVLSGKEAAHDLAYYRQKPAGQDDSWSLFGR